MDRPNAQLMEELESLRRKVAEFEALQSECKRAEKALRDRLALEELVATISTRFINIAPDAVDLEIERALQAIGEFVGAGRSFLLLSSNGMAIDQVYGWRAKGVSPLTEPLRGLLVEPFQWSIGKLKQFDPLVIPCAADLPPEANVEKKFLEAQAIQSVVAIPILWDQSLIGLFGFSAECDSLAETWAEEDVRLLKLVGEIFVNALARRRAEGALRESQRFTQRILDAIPNPVFYKDAQGVYLGCNAAFENYLGLPREQIVGKSVYDLSPKDLADIYHEADLALFHQPGLQVYEASVLHADGSRHNVIFNKATFLNDDGSLGGLVGAILDITERKQVEKALQESEARYRALVEKIPAIIYIAALDESSTTLYASPQTEMLLGYTQDDFAADPDLWRKKLHSDDLERVMAELARSHVSGEPFVSEYRMLARDGSEVWFHDEATLVRDDSGRPLCLQGIMFDVTERMQMEEALKRRNEELMARNAIATTIGQSLDLEYILNATLDTVLEVIAADAGWIQLLDDQVQGVLRLAAQRGFLPDMAQEAQAVKLGEGIAGQVAQSGQPIVLAKASGDPRLNSRTGRREDLQALVAIPIKSKDKVLGVLGVFNRSPRELRSREVQLLTAVGHQIGVAVENARLAAKTAEIEMLRELDRLRSELIANMSHELKTPLGLIEVFCTTLLRDDVEFDRETQQEFLGNIKDETDKLEELVDNMLDMSRMQSGQLRLDKHLTDVGQLARKVLHAMEIQFIQSEGHRRHRFVHSATSDQLAAMVDPKRIEQVLRNLLSNAVKYSPDGGTITIHGALRGHGDEKQLLMRVSDQGIGIPPEEVERIFERFYRVENEVTQGVRGAGLGLAVCRGIVEAHGGRIWVESVPGAGSTFYFTLPVNAKGSS